MLFQSEVVTAASGSIGGVTYSHTRSGMYRRARAVPVNPNTGNQILIRDLMATYADRWTNVLTSAERAAWNLYAANVPVTNALGSPHLLSGQNWYIGNNVAKQQPVIKLGSGGAFQIDTAPIIFDRGSFTTPTFLVDAVTGLSTTFDNTDAWANENSSTMQIFMGKPQNASRQFFKGPFRLVAVIEGDAVTPPTSPQTTSLAVLTAQGYVPSVGQAVWCCYTTSRADSRLSTKQMVGPIIVTP